MITSNPTPAIYGHAFMDFMNRNRSPQRTIEEMQEIADEFCRVNGLPLVARVEPSKPISAALLVKRKAGRRCYEAFGRRIAAPNN